jgi:hypothetical protein
MTCGRPPACFFLHFGNDYETGSAATKRQLEFFHLTDMDFLENQADRLPLKPAGFDFLRAVSPDGPGTGQG